MTFWRPSSPIHAPFEAGGHAKSIDCAAKAESVPLLYTSNGAERPIHWVRLHVAALSQHTCTHLLLLVFHPSVKDDAQAHPRSQMNKAAMTLERFGKAIATIRYASKTEA